MLKLTPIVLLASLAAAAAVPSSIANIPDFDFAHFTGDLNGPQMPHPTTISTAAAEVGMSLPTAQDLADVTFTPAFFTNPHNPHNRVPNQQQSTYYNS